MFDFKLSVGTVVKVTTSFMNEPAGVHGIIYESYNHSHSEGVSVITQNGTDLGGFSKSEQEKFLQVITHFPMDYRFTNAIQLAEDFRSGRFTHYFAGLPAVPKLPTDGTII